jgi:AraC-like DNA-binding protein
MKQKMSEKRRGKNNWAYGKAFDVEYRKKLSDSHKGKKPSTKTILKRIEKIKGRTKISHEQILDLYDKRKSGWSMKDLETNSNVSRTTLYTYFKKIDSKQLIINI